MPLWYEGPNLSTDEEYYQHISGDRNLGDDTVGKCTDDSDSDSSDDESENEYPPSNATLSSSDDEFWNYRLAWLLLWYNSNFVFCDIK